MKLLSIIATWSLSTGLAHAVWPKTPEISDFDWSVLEPSATLDYKPCYDGHKCAKLLVPLDWLDPSNPARVTLAVIARPAVVDETDPSFGGTVFTNPGGPSGSGISLVLGLGDTIRKILDGDKKYELLSFDPRGVGLSTPNADCFGDEYTRGGYLLEDRSMGKPDAGPEILKRKFAKAAMVGRLCETRDVTNNIRGYMSTSSVARDMVQIVDVLAEMRNETGTRDQSVDGARAQVPLGSHGNSQPKVTPRIQYWGFSYGTVLGNTFASMFPGRVGRMILEAVDDPVDYYNGTWILNLKDTQTALDSFWDTCFEAGTRCALYDSTIKAPADIESKTRDLINRLGESPEVYISPDTVTTITKQDILNTMFNALYNPMGDFPDLASTLADALAGNFTRLVQHLNIPKPADSCPSRQPSAYTWGKEAQHAIACGDSVSQSDMTVNKFQEYIGVLKADSPDFGGLWSAIRLACSGWNIRPNYTFSGPWVTPKHDPNQVDGKPAAPLLLVSSLLDPVTPLANAYEVAKGHPGSVVLIQDNVGHGTVETPGKCRDEFIRAYMETGELPDKRDVFCKADCKPFEACPGYEEDLDSKSFLRPYEL